MSDTDNAFAQATDNLIALYRNLERSALDLPLFSAMPMLIILWASIRFYFFLIVGIFLIVPINLLILIRNIFPGHWKYRPFFLRHLCYIWLWIWRGEAPIGPSIFIRPLLTVLMKAHFEKRLRRLRLEILLHDGLSEAARSSLRGRLDAALERWSSPKFTVILSTALLPAIIALPGWYKQAIDFGAWLGINMPLNIDLNQISQNTSDGLIIGGFLAIGYLLIVPVTTCLAKRGVFLGAKSDRICFPGGQEDAGAYIKEKEILGSVGLHARETSIDLWLIGIVFVLGLVFNLKTWDVQMAFVSRVYGVMINESAVQIWVIVYIVVYGAMLLVASLRRGRTGRA